MGRVNSSVIREYEYDADAQVLYITFVGGKTYGYDLVPADVYDDLVTATSKGEFFNRHIRDRYRYALVTLRGRRSRR
jgi:KTSC domain